MIMLMQEDQPAIADKKPIIQLCLE